MLKLTKKADYGLIALRHLASTPGGMSSTKDIAEAYHLPVPLLAKVLQRLTRAGILQSLAGTNGGYRLARDAAPYQRPRSGTGHRRPGDSDALFHRAWPRCDQSDNCTVREPLRRVHEAILELLNKFTITDLAESPAAVTLTPLLPINHQTLHPAEPAGIRN